MRRRGPKALQWPFAFRIATRRHGRNHADVAVPLERRFTNVTENEVSP